MIQIQPEPDLQRLLQLFTSFIRQKGVGMSSVLRNNEYSVEIYDKDRLGMHRSVLLSLCTLLSYCYEKQFVVDGKNIVSVNSCRRPVLEQNDLLLHIFQKWKKNRRSRSSD